MRLMPYHYSHGYLETTTTQVFESGDRPMVVVSRFVTNTSGSNSTYTLYHVPADETQSDVHAIVFTEQVRTGVQKESTTPILLAPGDRLEAKADVAGRITFSIYAVPYSDWVAGGR